MAGHNDFGKHGEIIAREFLESAGYEIMDENWIFGKAEVDLIAYYGKKIIFIEVKTRSSNIFGEPEDFVNTVKQQNMELAANEYIEIMNFEGEVRFDIISILFGTDETYTLNHIEDAFWPD